MAGVTSLPVRGAWIEILGRRPRDSPRPSSLPVRGAWIEMLTRRSFCRQTATVAPRAGSVD